MRLEHTSRLLAVSDAKKPQAPTSLLCIFSERFLLRRTRGVHLDRKSDQISTNNNVLQVISQMTSIVCCVHLKLSWPLSRKTAEIHPRPVRGKTAAKTCENAASAMCERGGQRITSSGCLPVCVVRSRTKQCVKPYWPLLRDEHPERHHYFSANDQDLNETFMAPPCCNVIDSRPQRYHMRTATLHKDL